MLFDKIKSCLIIIMFLFSMKVTVGQPIDSTKCHKIIFNSSIQTFQLIKLSQTSGFKTVNPFFGAHFSINFYNNFKCKPRLLIIPNFIKSVELASGSLINPTNYKLLFNNDFFSGRRIRPAQVMFIEIPLLIKNNFCINKQFDGYFSYGFVLNGPINLKPTKLPKLKVINEHEKYAYSRGIMFNIGMSMKISDKNYLSLGIIAQFYPKVVEMGFIHEPNRYFFGTNISFSNILTLLKY